MPAQSPRPIVALVAFALACALAGCDAESPEPADAAPAPDAGGPDMSDAIQCIVDSDCAGGQICDAGRCTAPPECDCPAVVEPVCGIDGVDYENACQAECAGVPVRSEGACPEPCVCNDDAGPVCGADGNTYDSACEAGCADVEVDRPGPCEGVPCGSRGQAPCADGSFCDLGEGCGADDRGGACQPIPAECPAEDSPACGCDGETYDNACAAHAAGVSVASEGVCPEPCECPDVEMPVCGADGQTYGNACEAGCVMVEVVSEGACPNPCGGAAGPCADDEFCDGAGCDGEGLCRPRPRRCDDALELVCGCDGETYANACDAQASGARVERAGSCQEGMCAPVECGPQPGLPNYRCEDGSIGGPTGRCVHDEAGVCGWEIRECPDAPDPVACGARLGDTCAGDQFCDFARDGCDFADATGTCRPQPVDCGDAFQPVCGCNGQSFDSPCQAHAARTDVANEGRCEGDPGPPCAPAECGPQPGLPNVPCDDGSVGGPTGRCLRGADNRCGWEVRACP